MTLSRHLSLLDICSRWREKAGFQPDVVSELQPREEGELSAGESERLTQTLDRLQRVLELSEQRSSVVSTCQFPQRSSASLDHLILITYFFF